MADNGREILALLKWLDGKLSEAFARAKVEHPGSVNIMSERLSFAQHAVIEGMEDYLSPQDAAKMIRLEALLGLDGGDQDLRRHQDEEVRRAVESASHAADSCPEIIDLAAQTLGRQGYHPG